ncbi:MAG TPA: 16S rRNA (cytosine(1402)-N(4))-methyltransferase RsmH [Candidatus Cryptobacteroides merdipullorum]|uniref:Ribosomal RNA small subunit methyltransferase H n=1 Tax=Candidatus Cryptobacteroides merdipullorum TaxID=2840771 RepID=A0A9D1GNI5_9BACT|nr:16S rRNA (cytosine(1402)-N(4))-methyltransferase RsmH [Candidatus Cryptobacteroides merdipullorum]
MTEYHNPVLLHPSVDAVVTNPDGLYVDATFGGGGHSREILSRLSPKGRLLAFDRDSEALAQAPDDPRLTLIHNNFRFIHNYVLMEFAGERLQDEGGADGILADLGVSSHQFDTAERGFSFRYDSPLDMRMNAQGGRTAADIVNSYTQEELERVLRIYGEVDNAGRLSQLIVAARSKAPILTTADLDKALASALPSFAQHKQLARIYQAFRIEVNDEMRSLEKFLEGAAASLKPGGRLAVITYHSIEDRIVKNFMRSGNIAGIGNKDAFGRSDAPLRPVNRKPVVPGEEEIASNTRARSAKLRVAERLPETDGRKGAKSGGPEA